MKRIRISLFAAFRDAAGRSSEVCETTAATTGELFDELCAAHEGLRREASALVAINDTMAAWDSQIEDGDEVLYFPPVAGG